MPDTKVTLPKTQIYGEYDGLNRLTALKIDIAGGLEVIESPHHEIHEGCHFVFTNSFGGLNSGASAEWMIFVNSTEARAHTVFSSAADGLGDVSLFESPTIGTSGTLVTSGSTPGIYNRKREATNGPFTTIYHSVVSSADGLGLFFEKIPGSNVSGESQREESEWLLNNETLYVLRFTSRAATVSGSVKIDFYEEELAT
jgi:hypothetical protein